MLQAIGIIITFALIAFVRFLIKYYNKRKINNRYENLNLNTLNQYFPAIENFALQREKFSRIMELSDEKKKKGFFSYKKVTVKEIDSIVNNEIYWGELIDNLRRNSYPFLVNKLTTIKEEPNTPLETKNLIEKFLRFYYDIAVYFEKNKEYSNAKHIVYLYLLSKIEEYNFLQ